MKPRTIGATGTIILISSIYAHSNGLINWGVCAFGLLSGVALFFAALMEDAESTLES